MAYFEIKNLSFRYSSSDEAHQNEKNALHDINLQIEKGQYIVLCGGSGSGKTTLLRQLKSVSAPRGQRSGLILLDGKPIEELSLREQAQRIGFVMQEPENQIVTDKVWHEMAFGLESIGMDQSLMRLRVAEMASYFGIQQWFEKDVAQLSGGQKQLLNLASVMAMQPDILILDEPTSQLDPIAAADFLNTVKRINIELRTTVIITEHRLEDILPEADKVVVMEEGEIAAEAAPNEIGHILYRRESRMFDAMPTPVRIYYELENKGKCPLTVREGGDWLSALFREEPPRIRSLSEISLGREKAVSEKTEKESTVLYMKNLWFRYERDMPDVLKGVNFKAPRGRLSAIAGGNGTGKSTLLKAACGICRPYRGRIYIHDKPLEKYRKSDLFKGCIAMLPQDPQSLFVKESVWEELLEMIKTQDGTAEERLINVAELCDIKQLLKKHPYDISGGEQQRTALAKVLMTRPDILLLDEPTKGLDSLFKRKLAKILKELNKEGVTVVMVSHDIEFCAEYADSISMFFDGKVITTDTPERFFTGNSFYTTAANRMSRHLFSGAVTGEDVIRLCRENLK